IGSDRWLLVRLFSFGIWRCIWPVPGNERGGCTSVGMLRRGRNRELFRVSFVLPPSIFLDLIAPGTQSRGICPRGFATFVDGFRIITIDHGRLTMGLAAGIVQLQQHTENIGRK